MSTTSNQLAPGMTISIGKKVFRVESCVKVTVSKGVPFFKTKLKDLVSGEVEEKNFKVDQEIDEVTLTENRLEFLYLEGKDFLFLDVDNLSQALVPRGIVADKVDYLKDGIQVKATFYGDTVFSVELPQFLELSVLKTEASQAKVAVSGGTKTALLETGAKIEVPLFIEAGDIIKVDTHAGEYIQRI